MESHAISMGLILLVTAVSCVSPSGVDSGEPHTDVPSDTATVDSDHDGFSPSEGDCDDSNANAYPGAAEICDAADNDCDGTIDEDDHQTWYEDADGDAFGDAERTQEACAAPAGFVADSSDCDDSDPLIHPDATEICDDLAVDEDCDDLVNDADDSVDRDSLTTYYADADADGFGDEDSTVDACQPPSGHVLDEDDCADDDPARNPAALEVCNNIDDDCDGLLDDTDPDVDTSTGSVFYIDADGDGYGIASATIAACTEPSGYSTVIGDCDDSSAEIHPGATEVCDSDDSDEDCDGAADDADSNIDQATYSAWYADHDEDGFGDPEQLTLACDQPPGHVSDSTDCEDDDATINPAGAERCDDEGIDEDCDGTIDDADSSVDASTYSEFYADSDSDGFGDADTSLSACDPPAGYVADDTDCADSETAIHPSATEVCDDVDNDCNQQIDDDDAGLDTGTAATWYADADSDGFGDTEVSTLSCESPSGYSADPGDCDDTDAEVNPDATEICDLFGAARDNDCDDAIDDADTDLDLSTASIWYADSDGDGYGDPSESTRACELPPGYVEDASDCDDTEPEAFPENVEVWYDGLDGDCGGDDDFDADSDGYSSDTYGGTDCDDSDPAFSPGVDETWYDGVDSNCDSAGDDDADGDGFDSDAHGGTDCDDDDAEVNPSADESGLDGVDNDCDGEVDLLDITTADAKLTGDSTNSGVGEAIASAGDMNGDGLDDILIGAYAESSAGYFAGAVYVVLGVPSGSSSLSSAASRWGGESDWLEAGYAVSGTGDIDDDGFDDILIGAPGSGADDSASGIAYLVHGPVTGESSLSIADAAYSGEQPSDWAGAAVHGGGDVNGDGVADVLVGAPQENSGGDHSGAAYLLLGPATGEHELSSADAKLTGEGYYSSAGHSVSIVGDTNGDGMDDVLVGAPFYTPEGGYTGCVYVALGPVTGTQALSSVDAVLSGVSEHTAAGYSLSQLGDMNGDGLDDILVGTWLADYNDDTDYAAHIVHGPVSGSHSLSESNVSISGGTDFELSYYRVAGAGDVNGDGTPDVLVGVAYENFDYEYTSRAHVLLGPLSGTHSLPEADARLASDDDDDAAGRKASSAGDLDGDGLDDILVGASGDDEGDAGAGAVYVFLGASW